MPVPKKPASLIYGVDDTPPPLVTALNGIQHVGVIAINLVYPLLIFRAAGAPVDLITNLLAIGMLVLAVGTFLHAHTAGRRRLQPFLSDGAFVKYGLVPSA